MIEKITVTKYTCGNPDCDAEEQYIAKGDEPPLGLQVTFEWHHGAGGGGGKVFACSPECLPAAIHDDMYGNR